MNKYNAEHYRDDTAAIAISRVDRQIKRERVKGRYLIGDKYIFKWENGVLRIWQTD